MNIPLPPPPAALADPVEIHGRLIHPSGPTPPHHDPATKPTRLPGDPPLPADLAYLPPTPARGRVTTVRTRPAGADMVGHRDTSARPTHPKPPAAEPSTPALIRPLAPLEQVLGLRRGDVRPRELAAVTVDGITALRAPQARKPVVEVPAGGMIR
ncbi:hypothetical protein [Kitasatospora sp. NPDC059327]|uniref:hypothetical protein n=1 Tax=Kitasatospora sp. NPDC059327 TaxID=3346803 RepID=UPI0036BE7AAC